MRFTDFKFKPTETPTMGANDHSNFRFSNFSAISPRINELEGLNTMVYEEKES